MIKYKRINHLSGERLNIVDSLANCTAKSLHRLRKTHKITAGHTPSTTREVIFGTHSLPGTTASAPGIVCVAYSEIVVIIIVVVIVVVTVVTIVRI